MSFLEGFLLGLSTGAVCLAYCGIVLIPYLLGEGKNIKRNSFYVSIFLAGRLIAYIIIGILSGILGKAFLQPGNLKIVLIGTTYILLAVMLIFYGFYRFKEVCLGQFQQKVITSIGNRWPVLVPFIIGVITGLNICPPFLLAITKAADTGNLSGSIIFFIMFFLGTSLYFLPLPFIGLFRRQLILRIVGKFAAILTGLFYLYQGIFMVLN